MIPELTPEQNTQIQITAHLQRHLTDGYWHDGCRYCLRRRVHGGTGLPGGKR